MLQSNNKSMATVVETFIIEETSELIHDNEKLEQWNLRVDELGLQGQKSVVVVGKSPLPFLWMNTALVSTFETLCPTKVDIKKYDKTPIPVEILDLVALSVKEEYFYKMEIWYNEKDLDPVCVGYVYDHNHNDDWGKAYYAKKYLIGRWADVKASLDSLAKLAKELFIEQTKNSLTLEIRQRQRHLEDIDLVANEKFGGAMPTTPGLAF